MDSRRGKLLIWVACALWACGGGEAKAPGTDVDAGPRDVPGWEQVSLPDVLDVRFAHPDQILQDLGFGDSDLQPGDINPLDEAPQCDAMPYPFGCPCESNTQCQAGWCVEGKDGKLCTMSCYDECPKGYTCSQVPGTCPDCEFVCAPLWVSLCRPCTGNTECQQSGLATKSYCVDYGDAGRFCGTACEAEADCPEGYLCEEVETLGPTVTQCVPAQGECECSPLFVSQQATTDCFVQNTWGKCPGERFCGAEGLTACDAPEPVKELCDSLDNDCDGLLNEDMDICPGGKVCQCAGDDCSCVCGEGLKDCGEENCTNTTSSVDHCGGCGQPCTAPQVETYACQGSVCKIVKCQAGYENYDGEYDNGCECEIQPEICDGVDNDCDGAVDEGEEACPGVEGCQGTCVDGLCECPAGCTFCDGMCVKNPDAFFYDPDHCGSCGNKCSLENTSVHACDMGVCSPLECTEGFSNCDGLAYNGCEWELVQEKCNCVDDDCDGESDELPLADCAPPKQCVNCFCQCPTDDPDIMDCGEDGCINVGTNAGHCGWCGNDCAEMAWPAVKTYGCEAGICTVLGCEAGFFNTNGEPWDGCECEKTANAEACDFVDNDCDGEVDEAPLTDCKPPKVCEFGMCSCPLDEPNLQECVEGQCIDVFTNPKHCGFCDNDCADLAWPNVQQYGCADGQCTIVTCHSPWVNVNAMDFDGCECEKTAAMETCDLVDNNCNGEVDEVPNDCTGQKVCLGGQCMCPPEQPNLQDCGTGQCLDTNVDPKNCGFCGNACALDNVAYQKCEAGQCVVPGCKPGWKDCDGVAATGCEFEVKVEECNGFDDDCDGDVDENPIGINQPCETGLPGLCEKGVQKCVNGALQCQPNIEPGQIPEVCDGKDNDCDGQVDNGNPGGGGPCTVKGLAGECKVGQLECTDGTLTCIQTVFPQPETCDGKDNDCDSVVDQIEEDCFTVCGNGKKVCNGGVWGNCSAMPPKTCKNWDTCNMEEMCVQQCPSAPVEQCNGQDDDCDGQVDETFTCTPGEQKQQACGMCGVQYSTCTNTCNWGNWGMCEGQGECNPGASKMEGACEKCGQSKYTCSNQCYWEYSGCVNQGQCNPGQTKHEGSCGNCGQKLYSCSNSCSWSYQGCDNEGVCSPGAYKYDGSCGNCGDQRWKCSNSCAWSKDSCQSQGECSPGSTKYDGSCGDCGEYKYTCSNSCSWSKQAGCYHEGVCSPGDKVACDGCKAKVCQYNCTWSSCGSSNVCGTPWGEGGCGCDSACTAFDDCCPGSGSNSACGACNYGCNSCEDGECGGSGGNCYCDDGCTTWGDCCDDARDTCGVATCAGHCGEEFPGCDCDWNCWMTSCCEDKDAECN